MPMVAGSGGAAQGGRLQHAVHSGGVKRGGAGGGASAGGGQARRARAVPAQAHRHTDRRDVRQRWVARPTRAATWAHDRQRQRHTHRTHNTRPTDSPLGLAAPSHEQHTAAARPRRTTARAVWYDKDPQPSSSALASIAVEVRIINGLRGTLTQQTRGESRIARARGVRQRTPESATLGRVTAPVVTRPSSTGSVPCTTAVLGSNSAWGRRSWHHRRRSLGSHGRQCACAATSWHKGTPLRVPPLPHSGAPRAHACHTGLA